MHGGLLSCPITRNQESHDGVLLFLQLFSWYQSRNISSRIFFFDPPPMATSSDAATMLPLSLLPPVTEKLTRGNYSMWLAQVSANLQGAQLWDFTKPTSTPPPELLPATTTTDGKKSEPTANPEYTRWLARDSQVRGYLFSSLSKDIFSQVATSTMAAEVWAAIQTLQASQSRAWIMATRMALATTTKGSSTTAEFFTKMKGLADDMASAGKKIEDDELISYILMGVGEEYEPVTTSVANRTDPISLAELQAQIVSFEQRRDIRGGSGGSHSSAMMSRRGGGQHNPNNNRGRGNRGGYGRGHPRGGQGGGGRAGGGRGRFAGVQCQVCGLIGHAAARCYNRYDSNYDGTAPPKSASAATTTSYGIDTNWYVDSGATDHITGDLEKLTVRDKYQGGDQVHAANGSGSGNGENNLPGSM
ncbi:uncharacterized protein LOC110434092 isoform X1 [Sorghum bicolor]|uniref:uncharacterized protein LOC110434092 isoform X1 n=1 Tax=Sorghum bicolor TaxID=4558 RepID=UPI000B425B2F|nr:uncharacterized protein LOC110434092 isoform X1 [Sorghum bicolor]|eukprot:XP_021313466.1 uncharacterized protein LOC110434092 isoform X1 [Sorghum bicolor]